MGTDPALVWSPDGGSIAFTYFPRDAASGVFTIRKDGSHLRRLTTGGTPAAWLPDGTRLALLDEPRQLHVVNADGKARQRLTDLGPLEAAWSPDGARIALVTFDGLFVAGADGRGLRMLHPTPLSYIERIAWSLDGRRISFGLELDPLAGGFGVVDVDGGVVAFSSKDGYRWDSDYAMDASWSPDRRTIAIAKPEGGIDLVSADGVAWNRLSDTGEGPAWSPDGRRIAFSDSGDIYVVLSDGTGRRKLTEQLPTPPATERVSTDRDGSMRARKAPP
jgi:Tol biopolymer transport system component